jgi:predicted aldo/keto reductase-like oxidoreductase
MKNRVMEKIGMEVSLLGFGCMRFPEIDGKPDMTKVCEMVSRAYDSGVNYFDTAYVYGAGESEKAIGKALAEYPRGSYYFADKLPIWEAKEQADLEKLFNTSLERLGTDYIDFYLLHAIDKDNWKKLKEYGAIEFCQKKQAQGKIRFIGFSFHDDPELFAEVTDAFDWDFVQIQLNYLDWDAMRAKELYEIIEKKNLSCVVMEPVRGGGLANPPEDISDVFKKANPEVSISSWALRFCASLPSVKVILSGMSNIEQVSDNIATLSDFEPLNKDEYKTIDQAVEIMNSKPHIGCTACRYCMPCPYGVDIPGSFGSYNDYMKLHDNGALHWNLGVVLKDKGPEKCVKCGVCIKKCPQHLNIPDELTKVSQIKVQAGI